MQLKIAGQNVLLFFIAVFLFIKQIGYCTAHHL